MRVECWTPTYDHTFRSLEVTPMVLFSHIPKDGEWYLTVTCQVCRCRLLLFLDLNNGNGNIQGVFNVTCPRCKRDQTLPAEHYRHSEKSQPDLCLEIL